MNFWKTKIQPNQIIKFQSLCYKEKTRDKIVQLCRLCIKEEVQYSICYTIRKKCMLLRPCIHRKILNFITYIMSDKYIAKCIILHNKRKKNCIVVLEVINKTNYAKIKY